MPSLPRPRGPVSEMLVGRLRQQPGSLGAAAPPDDDPLVGEDTQLSLHLLYGLHVDGFDGVDDGWEWDPSLLRLRARVERRFEQAVREAAPPPEPSPDGVAASLHEVIDAFDGPSLSRFVAERGTRQHLQEFVVHRSVYQRKEADGHTFAIPRLRGLAKSALIEIQADEYGGGQPGRSHAELFATTMEVLGLDPSPGAYVDVVPAITLATDNLVMMLGLHRRLRAALVGHLAVFEMTSVVPMGRYADAVRRIVGGPEGDAAAEFYDVHVAADAHHEVLAADRMAAGLVADEPSCQRELLWGAAAVMHLEARFAAHLLTSWQAGTSSLREPPAIAAA